MAFNASVGDHDHFARFDFAHEFGADDVQRTGLRGQRPAIADFAQHQRAHAQWVTAADQLGAGHGDDGKRAFDLAQGFFHAVGDVLPMERAIRWMMHSQSDEDWKDRAAFDQFAAQGVGVGDVAVVRNRRTAHGEFAKERLHVAHGGLPFGPAVE